MNEICEECGGTGYTGINNNEICNSCMGLGTKIRMFRNVFGKDERSMKFGYVAMMLLGMILLALMSSTGQIRVRLVFRITGFYVFLLLTGLLYNIISIPKYISRLFEAS